MISLLPRLRRTLPPLVLPALCALTLGSGCGALFFGSDSGGDGNAALEACAGGADIDDNTLITAEYGDSLHELVACGGLAVRLCSGATAGIFQAIIAQSMDATPSGWTYEGSGVYSTGDEATDMRATFFLAEDTSFGNAGDPIEPNIFLVSSYLEGVVATIDIEYLTVHYDQPGPLVELMGFGLEPSNPLLLTFADLADIEAKLGQMEFESTVVVNDVRDEVTVGYHVETPRMSAAALLGGTAMDFTLDYADATRADLDQALTVDTWGLEFSNGSSGALNGAVDYQVPGGLFDFQGTITFDDSTYGEIQNTCPPS